MPNYFYTDASGQRQGPINDQLLRVLVAQKTILPTTSLETAGGHKGVAGQIPGLFPATPAGPIPAPPTSSQLFCTNCGTACSEQAVACMSCGAKPTGHKRFCRHCGAALNPEQVICTRCGAGVAAGYSGEAKRVVQAVISASNIEKAKKTLKLAIFAAVAVGLVLLIYKFVPISSLPGLSGGNPFGSWIATLNRAKPGDWVKYETTIVSPDGDTEKGTATYKVVSKEGKKIRLQITMDIRPNRFEPPDVSRPGESRPRKTESHEVEIDLSKSPKELIQSLLEHPEIPKGPRDFMKNVDVAIKRGRTSRGTMSVAGEKFNCAITSSTFTIAVGNIAVTIRDVKEWTSEKVPVFGSVKMEWQTTVPIPIDLNDVDSGVKMKTFSITTTLVEYGW